MTEQIDIKTCCSAINPCEALCLLNNAALDIALGKSLMSYKVGEQTFNLVKPSLKDVKIMITHYEGLCNKSKGKPARRRAKVCFVHAENTCGTCEQTSCRCR